MRPEIDLLLCSASFLFVAEVKKMQENAPVRDVDWSRLLAAARYHRSCFPLFRFLSGVEAGRVPSSIMDELRRIQLSTLAFNLQAARELVEVATALERAGCPAVVYKGPLLAAAAYGDLAARQFTDLDILVRPEHLERACRELRGKGFRLSNGLRPMPSGLTLSLLRDAVFSSDRRPLPLEVQWRIAQGYHPVFARPEELWSRCRKMPFEGAEVLTFSPEDTLLILCLHGLYHAWGILQLVSDVAAAVVGLRPDWSQVLALAAKNRAEHILFLGLLLANRLLQVQLPARVLAKASSDRVAAAAADDCLRRFFQPEDWPDKARRFFFREARMFPGLGNQARYVLGRLITPNEEDLAGRSLTWGLLAGLPFQRLVRLFRRYFL